jgi:hypothetical protein
VFSAGNHGPGPNTVAAPATGYNVISVGALGSDTSNPTYDTVWGSSSRGPSHAFNAQTGATVLNARVRVDIAAPGQNLTLAYYGGSTGGNFGNPPNGGPAFYSGNQEGTSFAAPTVAGGIALMVDAGKTLGLSNITDGRVVKAVLLNSADKTASWNNGQVNLGGVVTTAQALDYSVGAGRMNLARTLPYLTDPASTRDVPGTAQGHLGTVGRRGYDFGEADEGTANSYTLPGTNPLGSSLTVTLNWFVDRTVDSFENPTQSTDTALADLDLEVWSVVGGVFTTLLAQSLSVYNNTEHLFLTDLPPGQIGIRVNYVGDAWDLNGTDRSENYGLAWDFVPVPEPGSVLGVMAVGLAGGWAVRRRRAAA